ncbi:MAG TPA: histidine kinase dimerization/phospho-acceptor domain-containing protein, partial [Solirubrobacterales bacterium]|nr:histidine kinase dimerization/phospho-acceptor domain-containing protein [Solirubrobacterales bacterium]
MPDDRSQRAKYLGFVAHEIKNPLSTALWSADLLKRLDPADRSGPRAEKMMDASLRALRRMRRLVDDYFTIERLDQKALEIRKEPIGLRGTIEGAIGLLAEKEKAEATAWALDVPAELNADCDGELLKRAIRACIERSFRAGAGPLSIVAQSANGQTTLWIGRRDAKPTGPLVPPPPEDQ